MFVLPASKILGLDGAPVKNITLGDDGKPIRAENADDLTLGICACNALLAPHEDESRVSGDEKTKRFLLATRLYGQNVPVKITVEEAAEIKKLVALHYAPLVVGRIWSMIEESEKAEKSEKAGRAPKN